MCVVAFIHSLCRIFIGKIYMYVLLERLCVYLCSLHNKCVFVCVGVGISKRHMVASKPEVRIYVKRIRVWLRRYTCVYVYIRLNLDASAFVCTNERLTLSLCLANWCECARVQVILSIYFSPIFPHSLLTMFYNPNRRTHTNMTHTHI